jgi:hypothetical protein
MRYVVTVKQEYCVEESVQVRVKLHDKTDFDTKQDPQYGYANETRVNKREHVLFEQSLQNLDITKVIAAVNNLKIQELEKVQETSQGPSSSTTA